MYLKEGQRILEQERASGYSNATLTPVKAKQDGGVLVNLSGSLFAQIAITN